MTTDRGGCCMDIKYIGVFAVFIACSALGFCLAGNEGKRVKNNDALISLIKHIRRKALYYRSAQSDIFESFESDLLEKNGFLDLLRKKGLYDAVESTKCFELDDGCERALLSFASEMGTLPIVELVSSCDALIDELCENQARLSADSPARQKAYSSLGMLFGIMIVILLV